MPLEVIFYNFSSIIIRYILSVLTSNGMNIFNDYYTGLGELQKIFAAPKSDVALL
jgi:hypothetical protein